VKVDLRSQRLNTLYQERFIAELSVSKRHRGREGVANFDEFRVREDDVFPGMSGKQTVKLRAERINVPLQRRIDCHRAPLRPTSRAFPGKAFR
jgi:hypothetical protein